MKCRNYLLFFITIFLHPLSQLAIEISQADGRSNLNEGNRLYQHAKYEEAAPYFWKSVLAHSAAKDGYTVEEAFGLFVKCYAVRGKTLEAYLHVAKESLLRGQLDMANMYLNQILDLEPTNKQAMYLKQLWEAKDLEARSGDSEKDKIHRYYTLGIQYFSQKEYAMAADALQRACDISNGTVGPACVNAIYCRTQILDWGTNGTQFRADMNFIEEITKREVLESRVEKGNGMFQWNKATSVHPHMMLGYPVDAMLQRYASESAAALDEPLARWEQQGNTGPLTPLPDGLPYDKNHRRDTFLKDATHPNFKIRLGFVSSGFNSKAVLYLSHNMFEFFDKNKFEVHVFSLSGPDDKGFIQQTMRGIDWRSRVQHHADFFHDVDRLKNDHIQLAKYIHDLNIHILTEWDGYARQGLRAQGLFALQPAPIQILHQEFLGTMGGPFVDYIITDEVTSPIHLQHLYVEKFMYMPHHFFSKGHAYQDEVNDPTFNYEPTQNPYFLGTGSPQGNRCLAPEYLGPKEVSFVYCNFNKFLKYNPETIDSWIKVLKHVPNSILCLLEYPPAGKKNLLKYIRDTSLTLNSGSSEDLTERIHFLPWQNNPFDHQIRTHDFCNVALDSHPYNGHTTAQDAMYGGVPVVTRSDGDDMSSRVTTSANVVLGLEQLNAKKGPNEYAAIAIKLGNEIDFFQETRERLIQTCLQRNPYHPYWDVKLYVQDFEKGLSIAFRRYLAGDTVTHISVSKDMDKEVETTEEL